MERPATLQEVTPRKPGAGQRVGCHGISHRGNHAVSPACSIARTSLKNPLVRGAPAQHGCHRLLNLRVRRVRCPIASRFSCTYCPLDAEPARPGLFVDEGFLERVRVFQAFERRDLGGSKGAPRGVTHDRTARPPTTVHAHSGTANPHPNFGPRSCRSSPQHVEQRGCRIDVNRVRPAIDLQGEHAHEAVPTASILSPLPRAWRAGARAIPRTRPQQFAVLSQEARRRIASQTRINAMLSVAKPRASKASQLVPRDRRSQVAYPVTKKLSTACFALYFSSRDVGSHSNCLAVFMTE